MPLPSLAHRSFRHDLGHFCYSSASWGSMPRVTLEATRKVVKALLARVTEQWGDAELPLLAHCHWLNFM